MFTVAIVGRPNVGKSTLFNRLTGTPFALVDDTPGVTRDRREAQGYIGPMRFRLFDTAGLENAKEGSLAQRMSNQSERAVLDADVALFVIDGRAGVTPEDKHFASRIRKTGKPVVLLVNKCEGGKGQDTVQEAYRLGFGDPVPFSSAHGEGMGELFEALLPHAGELPEDEEPRKRRKKKKDEVVVAEKIGDDLDEDSLAEEDKGSPPALHIAIVGRPNAGKSTLFNRLLGYERTLTGPEAGITRDSIAVDLEYDGKPLKLVDTAGMRKRGNVNNKIEKMAVEDSNRSIQYAQVAILVLDAEFALEKQDLIITDHIESEGRAIVVALNKWDKVVDKQQYLKDAYERLEDVMPQVQGVSIVPISAERGTHIDKLMQAVFEAFEVWNRRIPTRRLNEWLDEATQRHAPPIMNGRRMKLRYMTQIKTRPPTFALFASKAEKMPDSYKRYLINSMREVFKLPGVPIRIVLKKNKNPYV